MLSRSVGETRSSASISSTQSPWAASSATLRWAANPGHGLSITCAPAPRASSDGAIARAAVDDDHLVAEADALERRRQALLLVLHDQARGQALSL